MELGPGNHSTRSVTGRLWTDATTAPSRSTSPAAADSSSRSQTPNPFPGLPQDRFAPKRAIMLPDEAFASYFLDVFGRPQRISACECERVNEANLAQALHLLNSDEVQGKLARAGGRADTLAKDARPDPIKIDDLFLWAFAHLPSAEQKKAA